MSTIYSKNNYDRTAWFYERAANMYSGGKILASKRWQLRDVGAGDKLLFVGAGSGEDVILAVQLGAQVTVVELSPKMLVSIERKLVDQGLLSSVELICGDAFDYRETEQFDLVAANYFLFTPPRMVEMLRHLSTLLKVGGKLMIADFAPIRGNLFQRFLQGAYYYSAITAFHLIAKNPLHHIYDYTRHIEKNGLALACQKSFKVLPLQSSWYRSLELTKLS